MRPCQKPTNERESLCQALRFHTVPMPLKLWVLSRVVVLCELFFSKCTVMATVNSPL